jgi:hypothetical protein
MSVQSGTRRCTEHLPDGTTDVLTESAASDHQQPNKPGRRVCAAPVIMFFHSQRDLGNQREQ